MKLHEVQLEELIGNLEAERGIGGKVRLLAGSWPLLRQLSPRQRERVALAVGSRWVWRNLEGMFGHPDKLSKSQLQAKAIFEKMHDADPDELRKLSKELKKGGLAGARSRLLGALDSALEERIAVESDSQQPDSVHSQELAPGVGTGRRGKRPAAAVPTPPPPPPWLPSDLLDGLSEEDQATEQGFRRVVSTTDEPAAPDLDTKGRAPETPHLKRGAPEPERVDDGSPSALPRPLDSGLINGESQAPAESSPDDAPPQEPGETPTSATRRDEVDSSSAQSASAPEVPSETPREDAPGSRRRDTVTLSAVESLRALRRLSTGKDVSSRPDRVAFVDRLGSGWAARRAVSAMIRSHAIADLDEALTFVRRLPTETQQTWCLGDLLHHWQLDTEDHERVLQAAPTPAARRRLARRRASTT